mmetsp:Transcript_11517/g.21530  ORF Transcript_11517/g.21530 Transcript_11517/m.21530 type:complete len:131 (-) Transcript_11517:59-451(-)
MPTHCNHRHKLNMHHDDSYVYHPLQPMSTSDFLKKHHHCVTIGTKDQYVISFYHCKSPQKTETHAIFSLCGKYHGIYSSATVSSLSPPAHNSSTPNFHKTTVDKLKHFFNENLPDNNTSTNTQLLNSLSY